MPLILLEYVIRIASQSLVNFPLTYPNGAGMYIPEVTSRKMKFLTAFT